MKVATASRNSSSANLPLGVLASGGGGTVKPIGNYFRPLIESTGSGVMTTLVGAEFGWAAATVHTATAKAMVRNGWEKQFIAL